MKLHASVAALAAAAGAFAYGGVARAQATVVAPVADVVDGLTLNQDENLIVNPNVTISNQNASTTIDAVRLNGTGYNGQREILVNGAIVNYGNSSFQAISGTGGINDASHDSVTITVAASGSISTVEAGARAIELDDDITILNSGSMTANNVVVDVNNNLTLTNYASATISVTGAQHAIRMLDDDANQATNSVSITNAGSIQGGTFNRAALYVSNNAATSTTVNVVNTGSGSMTGGGGAIDVSAGNVDLTISGGEAAPDGPPSSVGSGTIGFSGQLAQTNANQSYDAINVDADYTATVTVTVGQSGSITSAGADAISVNAEYANVSVANEGQIAAEYPSGDAAISVYASESASLTVRNSGTISGQSSTINVLGEYGGSVDVSNYASGTIVAYASGAALDINISGEYASAPADGPAAGPATDSIIVRNDGRMATYDPGTAPVEYAPGVISVDANGGGSSIYNGADGHGVTNASATIYAPSTHGITLSGSNRGGEYGHQVYNGGAILAQADGRNGSTFNANAIRMEIGGNDGDTFQLDLTNFQSATIESRGDIIIAQDRNTPAYGTVITVGNYGSIVSDRGGLIENGGNNDAYYANISIYNANSASIVVDDEIVRSRVDNRDGEVSANIVNNGYMSSGDGTAAFVLRGSEVNVSGSVGSSGTIQAAGDVFQIDANGDNRSADEVRVSEKAHHRLSLSSQR